jgi:hypothetical protein
MKISLAGGVTGQTHPATIQKTTTQPTSRDASRRP